MRMMVQRKLTVLLCCVTIVSVGVLTFLHYSQKSTLSLLYNDLSRPFDAQLSASSEQITSFVNDYSYWDDLVLFLQTGNTAWASRNFDSCLGHFKTNALWICTTDATTAYTINNIGAKDIETLPLPKEALKGLFAKRPFCHFYVATAGGLMEIYGATIHPTEDSARKTPPRGYLFAGRLWNDRFVGEMARLSGSTIELTSARMPLISRDFEKGSKVVIQRQLPGWDGTAVQTAWIGVVAPTVASIERSLSRQFWALAALLAAIIGILYIFVSLEVSAPLGLLYQGLDSEDPVIAEQLSADRSEFGYIAQLVTKVFEQKTQLLSEIAQLKKTEESLGKDKERLTAQVVELSEEALSLKAALKQTADNREKMDQLTQEVTELRTAEKIFRSAYADMERKLEEANGRIEVVNELLQREILNEHEQRDVALTALAEKEKLEAELAAFKSDMANKDHDLMNEPPIVRPAIIIDKKIKSKKKDVPEITSFQASC